MRSTSLILKGLLVLGLGTYALASPNLAHAKVARNSCRSARPVLGGAQRHRGYCGNIVAQCLSQDEADCWCEVDCGCNAIVCSQQDNYGILICNC